MPMGDMMMDDGDLHVQKTSAKMGYCAIVFITKKWVGGPHLILPSKDVPGDVLGKWTGFKKTYPGQRFRRQNACPMLIEQHWDKAGFGICVMRPAYS
jgi:hypothetical protein